MAQALERLALRLKPYHGKDWSGLSRRAQKTAASLLSEYDEVVIRLARAGFQDHPLVAERIRTLRKLGDRDFLRRARVGLEAGVRPPWSTRELTLWAEIDSRRTRGKSLATIQRELAAKRLIPKMSRQAFHQLVTRLNEV